MLNINFTPYFFQFKHISNASQSITKNIKRAQMYKSPKSKTSN
jgi:hypothetical protein